MSLRIASLPQPADIDAGDASAAESAYRQIADIYDLVQTYELTLTPEQESAISQVIAAYYPAEEIAGMKSLPAGGGVLQSAAMPLRSDLSLQELDLTIPAGAEVTIELNGYTLTGTGEGSVITVESGGTLTVQDSSFYPYFRTGTITGGTGSEPKEESTGSAWTQFTVGGGIYVLGTLHMSGGTILDCTANAGGGVYIYAGSFVMTGGTIENCRVSGTMNVYGGGVQISGGGSFRMDGGSIVNCSVSHASEPDVLSFGGGGVSAYQGTFAMNDGLISGCSSDFNGGGIYVSDQTVAVTLSGGIIENCRAAVNGGGIFLLNSSHVTMTGGTIRGCQATGGGAVCVQGASGKLDLQGGTLVGSGNAADADPVYDAEDGGAIYVVGGTLQMSGGSIRNFTVSNNGGGIYLGLNGTLIITGGQVSRCTALNNGGGIYTNGTQASVAGCTISACEAGVNGGGVYVLNGTFLLGKDGVIEKCQAKGHHPALPGDQRNDPLGRRRRHFRGAGRGFYGWRAAKSRRALPRLSAAVSSATVPSPSPAVRSANNTRSSGRRRADRRREHLYNERRLHCRLLRHLRKRRRHQLLGRYHGNRRHPRHHRKHEDHRGGHTKQQSLSSHRPLHHVDGIAERRRCHWGGHHSL